ncbi:gamma-glutamyltransferase [Micromonospora sp. NBC_01796]|uniref:gamma-glutamyltransferase n=1 Tax=Micromonospora sp. NBC_01796 TaxID=2975987 RepID=UPI002DDC8B33|nr:gamma-glutamyltransferase [Micromonospora sp. NBC_01796]WSA84372.1 gamma-glutamyltransferase [Micromonospora sp. NBC_01796]
MTRTVTTLVRVAVAAVTVVAWQAAPVPAGAAPGTTGEPTKTPTAQGYGGAVSTVDPTATAVGIDVLRRGGNAVDAAVAAAATLGVTEPFSAGIGGGGFLLYYDARTKRVHTIDGRESAPAAMRENSFVDPATGTPYNFQEARVSGLSVGVPGTLLTWHEALRKWGTRSLSTALAPAAEVAERGFTVDATFRQQVADNAAAFAQFDATRKLYLPGGQPPAVGSTQRNRDLADTYRQISRRGVDMFYEGPIGADLVATVQRPPVAGNPTVPWQFPIRPGGMTRADLARYDVRFPAPTRSDYRGYDVYGMSTPSSGGVAVGEALNILERFDLSTMTVPEALHHYLEASALTYADRNRYVGDDTSQRVLRELLSDRYAAERACRIDPTRAAQKPVLPGDPDGRYDGCATATAGAEGHPGQSTTNLTVADRWGNVVEYTLTIEQTGGNAMVVPGRGFLLNNELTDFTFAQTPGAAPDPNLPAPGKRPRSSMSPTIVLDDGRPFLALGTPGGATIITTVLQMLVNRIDLGMSLPEAMAAPRASQRNSAAPQAEPAFITGYGAALTAYGHPPFTSTAELGAATAVEFTGRHGFVASAEPVRRGGGAAAVVQPGG